MGSSSRRLWLLALTGLLIALAFPFIYPLATDTLQESRLPEESSLPELMARAVALFNDSLRVIESSYRPGGIEVANASIYSEEAMNVSSKLLEEAAVFLGVIEDNTLVAAATEYARLAEAASLVYSGSMEASRVYTGLSRALSYLANCMVDEALREWNDVKPGYAVVENSLVSSLNTLAELNTSNLLSEDHKKLAGDGMEVQQKALRALGEAGELLMLAEKYRDLLESLCSASGQVNFSVLPQFQNQLSQVRPEQAGNLAYEVQSAVNALRSLINNALQQTGSQAAGGASEATGMGGGGTGMDGQGQGQIGESEGRGGGGSGAGRGEPPSDD
ncbi:MAG: hypothetical protein F7C07_04630 [Desulfurococcales archaeon]|nr:hypothetical protein [Desulfurococcales archaeon]